MGRVREHLKKYWPAYLSAAAAGGLAVAGGAYAMGAHDGFRRGAPRMNHGEETEHARSDRYGRQFRDLYYLPMNGLGTSGAPAGGVLARALAASRPIGAGGYNNGLAVRAPPPGVTAGLVDRRDTPHVGEIHPAH